MNTHQIAFILSVNNIQEAEECLRYIKRLHVPDGYETDILTIQEAASMAEAYDAAMKASQAKYKVYLHQDVFLIYPDLLLDMIEIFQSNARIGLMGVVGNSCMPQNAVAGMSWDSGKLFQNQVPQKLEYPWNSSKQYQEVEVVDGLFIATQYDVPWRKDIFDEWDFYDMSQCCEIKRKGYEVVVPFQKQCWCYHDNSYSKMLDFDRCRMKFIQEYQDIKPFKLEKEYDLEKNQEYEQTKASLIQQMKTLTDEGKIEELIEVFQIPANRGYLFLREFELISRIFQREQLEGEKHSVWMPGRKFQETQEILHRLKFLVKAVEYSAEEVDMIPQIQENYSKSAIICMIEEYCMDKNEVKERIFTTDKL